MAHEDYELGEAVEVERRPRAGVVISVRLSQDEADQLQELAQQRGTTLSRVAREAITAYLGAGGSARWVAVPWTGTTSYFNNLELIPIQPGSIVVTRGDVRVGEPHLEPAGPRRQP